jgi:hypothetical protein
MYAVSQDQPGSFPRYFDCTARGKEIVGGILLPPTPAPTPTPSRGQFRVYSPEQAHQAQRSFSVLRAFTDDMSATSAQTDTQDLTEFLKTSSPKDSQKSLKTSASDDEQVFSFGATYKKGFKFLRGARSKSKLKLNTSPSNISLSNISLPNISLPNISLSNTSLSNAVRPKTTSRGKPYLQIQIDYAPTYSTATKSPALSNTHSKISSDFTSVASQRPSTTTERISLSPAPWNSFDSAKMIDADTRDTFYQYINAERNQNSFDSGSEMEAKSKSLSIDAVGGDHDRMSRSRKTRRDAMTPPSSPIDYRVKPMDLHSYPSSPQNAAIKVGNRSSSLKGGSKGFFKEPTHSPKSIEESDTNRETSGRKQSRKALLRPGPPPVRELPALPETQDLPNDGNGESSHQRSISVTESLQSSNSSRYQATDEAEVLGRLREQKAIARKPRDVQLRRQHVKIGESTSTTEVNIVPNQSYPNNSSSQIRPPSQYRAPQYKNPGTPTPPHSPGIMYHAKKNALMPALSSPSFSSSRDCISEREADMEIRLQTLERKNRVLEQALVAVIRGTVGTSRQPDLQKANSLENLLQQLKMVDAQHTVSVPTA